MLEVRRGGECADTQVDQGGSMGDTPVLTSPNTWQKRRAHGVRLATRMNQQQSGAAGRLLHQEGRRSREGDSEEMQELDGTQDTTRNPIFWCKYVSLF